MKRFRMVAVVGSLAALTVGSAGVSASGARAQTWQFMSISKRTVFAPPVNRTSPPKVGGSLVFEDVMYNRSAQLGKPAGARIGRSAGVCTFIRVAAPEAQCTITAHLPSGDIVVVGEGDPGGKVMHYAITGGVGAYENAHGTVTSRAINDQKTIITVEVSV